MPQDFSGQNLQRQSFRGQNLISADFSNADIRGVDFSNANLRGANFRSAKAGLVPSSAILHTTYLCLLLGVSSFFSASAGSLISLLFGNFSLQDRIAGWTCLSIVIIFSTVIILRKGTNTVLSVVGAGAIVGTIVGTIAGIITVLKALFLIESKVSFLVNKTGYGIIDAVFVKVIDFCSILVAATIGAGAGAFAFTFGIIGVFVVIIAFSLVEAIAIVIAVFVADAVTEDENAIGNAFLILWVAMLATAVGAVAGGVTFTGVVARSIAVVVAKFLSFITTGTEYLVVGPFHPLKAEDRPEDQAIFFAAFFLLFGIYVARQTLKGNEKFIFVRNTAITFAAFRGTSFRAADLTDADFTQATLKSTDFRGAILTHTRWHQANNLDRVRPGTTYLKNVQLRQLLLTGQGQNQNFDRQDLRRVSLQNTNLQDASFIGADLSEANLQDADLSRAKLVRTQLDETNLTEAILTGATIEDWGITSHTRLDGVRCEYVFMRLETKDDPDRRRKPDNGMETFADGEFSDFIKPIVDTLDLYHSQGVDPRAIAISFKQLAENHPAAELEIVAMEKRGQANFLLRAKTAPDADRSELSAEYFSTYNQLKALAEQEFKALLTEKDSQIIRLENMVMTALERPSFYSNTQVGQVDFMSNNPGGISQNVSGGQMYGGMQAAQGNQNQQTMATQASVFPATQPTQPEVLQMLAELEQIIHNAELPAATKEEAISYLTAAKKATEKEEPNKERVKTNLEGVVETLQPSSQTEGAGKTVWEKAKPILLKVVDWLGAAAAATLLTALH